MEISQVLLEPSSSMLSGSSGVTGSASQPSLLTMYLVSQVLRIERADIDDNENIYCQAENDVGKATATIEINVHCK